MLILMSRFSTCLTWILFGLGTIAVSSQPSSWKIVYGNRAGAKSEADLQLLPDDTVQQQKNNPPKQTGLPRGTKESDPIEMSSLMRRLYESLVQIRLENNDISEARRILEDNLDGYSNVYGKEYGEDNGLIRSIDKHSSPMIFNGFRQNSRPLIPKRAHGSKCGIFKICSPLRMRQIQNMNPNE